MKRNNTETTSPRKIFKCLPLVAMSMVLALNSMGQGQVNWNSQQTIQHYEWEHDYGSMILSDEEYAALYMEGQQAQMMPPYPQVPFEGIHGLFLLSILGGALMIYQRRPVTA